MHTGAALRTRRSAQEELRQTILDTSANWRTRLHMVEHEGVVPTVTAETLQLCAQVHGSTSGGRTQAGRIARLNQAAQLRNTTGRSSTQKAMHD